MELAFNRRDRLIAPTERDTTSRFYLEVKLPVAGSAAARAECLNTFAGLSSAVTAGQFTVLR